MQQKMFVEFNEDSNSKKVIPKDHSYDEDFPKLDFILVPYAYLLGVSVRHTVTPETASKLLYELFSKPKSNRKHVQKSIEHFFRAESRWFKKDPSKAYLNGNLIPPADLQKVFVSGAVEMCHRHKSITELKKSFRKDLPSSDPPLVFGKIARYLNNGAAHEFWYEETGKEISELFPEFDPDLIKALLAITSIRTNLPSNVTKAFKALDQFHKNEFKGFLDAQLHHLKLLKSGESLTNPENLLKNGRKIKMFASAMGPVEDAIVDDVWITRAFGTDRKRVFRKRIISQSPTRAIYDATEWYLQKLAVLVCKKARGVCAMIWVGIRQETNKETARYTDPIKARLSHGLFSEQFGNLKPSPNGGIEFETLQRPQ